MNKQELIERVRVLDNEINASFQNIEQMKARMSALIGGKSELEMLINSLEEKEKAQSLQVEEVKPDAA